jgi:hypothetical protein
MPFRDPNRARDLAARIEHEVRERLEEAVDFVCLDALVRSRQARGLPAPAADSAADRAEYSQHVLAFLRLLDAEVAPPDNRRASGHAGTEEARLLAGQVARARALPDYWQRFEALSARFLADPDASGGERRGMLARLFSRG